MANSLIDPNMQGGPDAAFIEQNVQTENLSDGLDGGMGYGMIGVVGKNQFYIRYKGKKVTLVETPGGRNAEHFDFVILRKADNKSHTYYKGGYEAGSTKPPTCVSTDGIAPDDIVAPYDPDKGTGKQSTTCNVCPKHAWGPQPNGRPGRACQDSLRLAILPISANFIEASLGFPVVEPLFLRVMAASIQPLIQMGKEMNAKAPNGYAPYHSYWVRMTFDKSVVYPKFEFVAKDWLRGANARIAIEMRNDPLAYRIMGLSPEGNSLVRAGSAISAAVEQQHAAIAAAHTAPVQRIAAKPEDGIESVSEDEVAVKLAEERARRIAAIRNPQTIEAKVEEVKLPAPPPEEVAPKVASSTPDLDELVRRMRPGPRE